MKVKTISKTTILLFFAGSLFAATSDYFPLQVGNTWVYKAVQGRITPTQTVEVTGRETLNGREYYQVQFFGHEMYVRESEGSLYAFTKDTNQERLWLPFAASEGERTQSEFDTCSKSATIRSKNASAKTPAGEVNNALQLTYEGPCADAGVTTQFFVPGVGLVVHEETSLLGARRYELTYSRIGTTNLEAQQVSFTIALDSQVYDKNERSEMVVRLSVRNSSNTPFDLYFPSGQRFDLRIWNWRGEIVYTWSADKLFTAEARREPVPGGGERTFSFTAPLQNIPPGRYAAEAYLTTEPRHFSAVSHFEVR